MYFLKVLIPLSIHHKDNGFNYPSSSQMYIQSRVLYPSVFSYEWEWKNIVQTEEDILG